MQMKNQPERSSWSSRPKFTPRQVLTAKQLNVALDDELMRQRLLNRAIHGYGVAVGFGLVVDENGVLDLDRGCLEVTAGLALDRHGRMLYWKGGRLGMNDIVGQRPDCEGRYTLSAHFASRPPTTDGCLPFTSERAQWSKEGVVFTLRQDCHQRDRSCPEHPKGACISHDHYLGRRTGALPGPDPHDLAVSDDVNWISRKIDQPECSTGVDDWFYDAAPEVCVPIACVEICDLANRNVNTSNDAPDKVTVPPAQPTDRQGQPDHQQGQAPPEPRCEPRYGFCPETKPDDSSVRPFVYRNPLLYELVNGCDVPLSRVGWISWQDWIEPGWRERVPWPDFEQRITSRTDGLEIRFTRPIRSSTIHAASVFLDALTHERNSDYWVSHQVPLRLKLLNERDFLVTGVRLEPDADWLAAEVTGRRSSLFGGARFELTVRGQLLRDECNRLLDARPVDIATNARGQAMPGGDFISVFRVGHHRDEDGRRRSPTAGYGDPTASPTPSTTAEQPPVEQATPNEEESSS